jgi:alpha-N-arabinofuranosidase
MFLASSYPAVRHRLASLLALASVLAAAPILAGQDLIAVDVSSVVADVSRKPIGINVNFLLDDDANRTNAVESLTQALVKAGVRYLRYPGGEKSDGYLWSIPPYSSSVPTLARWAAGEYPQNREWPSYDRSVVEADGRTFKVAPLGFDEFMEVCKAIGCVPTIVVCYDSMYKPAQSGGSAPTREQLLETAREWVRYANITKGYNVKYWEIGNESYLQQYNGSATASNYARDLIEFSRAMKAVDPTIRIGANGGSDTWWQTVLPTAATAIDFLAIHNYFANSWGSYGYYQKNNVSFMAPVQAAQYAISTYAPVADRGRLMIAVTETNSVDWSGTWPHLNDMGHALALFDAFGAHLRNAKVAFTQLWNTRWLGNDTATTPSLWDALDKYNELQATGRSVAIWSQFLKETLVASSSTAMVRSYSTYSPSTGKLTIFLINKDTVSRGTALTIKNAGTTFTVDTWVFSGQGASDLNPTWTRQSAGSNAGTLIPATLDPVSVTVLDITPLTTTPQSTTLELGVAADTRLEQKAPDTNYGGGTTLWAAGNSNGNCAVAETALRFNLAGLSAGKTITAATLKLYVTNTSVDGHFQVYSLKRNWSEATATWRRWTASSPWASPGGNYVPDDRGRIPRASFTGTPGTTGYALFPLNSDGIRQVQAWVDGVLPNYGFLLRPTLASPCSNAQDNIGFQSREGANPPKLVITFH